MSLKLIPNESVPAEGKKQNKTFNPGGGMKKSAANSKGTPSDGPSLKELCLRLVHFVNRGGRYTFEQVDDIIVSLQHGILKLQKKKQDILRNKTKRRKAQ